MFAVNNMLLHFMGHYMSCRTSALQDLIRQPQTFQLFCPWRAQNDLREVFPLENPLADSEKN